MIAGLVLAGGRSTRFGSEKAVALVDGAPMIARVLAVLGAGCGALAVNAPAGSGAAAYARAHGLPRLPDPDGAPDGPLAGVLAGLRWAETVGAQRLATAPCDTPHLPPDLLARLGADRAYAVTTDGMHPLCAIWRVADRAALEEALSERRHPPVRDFLAAVGAVGVAFDDPAAFANLNTVQLEAVRDGGASFETLPFGRSSG